MDDNTVTWNKIIGDFIGLRTLTLGKSIQQNLYLEILSQKDNYVKEQDIDKDDDLVRMYETIDVYNTSEKKQKKTYKGKGKKKDKDGKTYEYEGDIPVKKYVTITPDVRVALQFLLNKMVYELHQYYNESNQNFPETGKLLTEFIVYCNGNQPDCVSPFIIEIGDAIVRNPVHNNEALNEGIRYTGLCTDILNKISEKFKKVDTIVSAPEDKIRQVIKAYLRFVKHCALYMYANALHSNQTVNLNSFLIFLRYHQKFTKHEFSENVFTLIDGYVKEWNDKKPKKSKATVTKQKESTDQTEQIEKIDQTDQIDKKQENKTIDSAVDNI